MASATILITNDDGYTAPGLTALAAELATIGRVVVVAPERDRSAVSHALTMRRPLRVRRVTEDVWAVDGTPADCVILAREKLLPSPPDLLVAGINPGPNIGDDISYSGTVSAAMEGTMLGIPSMAVSLANGADNDLLHRTARFARMLALQVLARGLPPDTMLNVNYPGRPPRGVRFTRQGRRTYSGAVKETRDPWGETHYWIGGGVPTVDARRDADGRALEEGYVSITPLHLDCTNYEALDRLRSSWLFVEGRDGEYHLGQDGD